MSTELDQETQKLMGFHKKVTPEVSEYQNDPELWAFEYQRGPYLKHVKEAELLERYSSLLFNKNFLFNSWFFNAVGYFDRYSFLSKNYWLRKIYQTELELKQRKIHIPEPNLQTYKQMSEEQFVLVKYGKKEFMERLWHEGSLRISPADTYDDSALEAARKDNELEKNWLVRGEEITITTADGKEIEAIGNVNFAKKTEKYHLFCISQDIHAGMFQEFEANACVIIHNYAALCERLEKATAEVLPGYQVDNWRVEYYDPYERRKDQHFSALLSKDFRFAYQQEYRFVWNHLNGPLVKDHQFLSLGSLEDIAKIVYL